MGHHVGAIGLIAVAAEGLAEGIVERGVDWTCRDESTEFGDGGEKVEFFAELSCGGKIERLESSVDVDGVPGFAVGIGDGDQTLAEQLHRVLSCVVGHLARGEGPGV